MVPTLGDGQFAPDTDRKSCTRFRIPAWSWSTGRPRRTAPCAQHTTQVSRLAGAWTAIRTTRQQVTCHFRINMCMNVQSESKSAAKAISFIQSASSSRSSREAVGARVPVLGKVGRIEPQADGACAVARRQIARARDAQVVRRTGQPDHIVQRLFQTGKLDNWDKRCRWQTMLEVGICPWPAAQEAPTRSKLIPAMHISGSARRHRNGCRMVQPPRVLLDSMLRRSVAFSNRTD